MKIYLFLLYSFLLFVVINSRKRNKKKLLEDSETDTGFDLRGKLRNSFFAVNALKHLGKNTICSPISALLPLGKLALGAEGVTLTELLDAIGVENKKEMKFHFKHLLAELKYLPGVKLDIACKLYVGLHKKLSHSFSTDAKEIFHSSAEKVDFGDPVTTADRINEWVELQTSNMIHDMVKPEDISPDSSLIIINGIYFNGKWETPFPDIYAATFHTPYDVRRVTMMSSLSFFNYTDSPPLEAEIVRLPYIGGTASMIIVLPKSKNGLPALLSQLKLAPELLDAALSTLREEYVHVTMPRFKLEAEMDLRALYEKIGVKRMFNTHESGLTGILRSGSVIVSAAKQKAVIDVNEQGTEAAASSSVNLMKLSFMKTVQFKADHPFLFFVMANGQQLFAGTLVQPPH